MTKKIFLLFIILSFALLSNAQNNKTEIFGSIEDKANYEKIYLDTLGVNPNTYLTSKISEKGEFSFALNITKSEIFRLKLDDKNFLILILSPGEKVKISIASSKLGVNTKVDGSFHTNLLYESFQIIQNSDAEVEKLNNVYMQALKAADTTTSKQIVSQIKAADSSMRAQVTQKIDLNPNSLAWLFLFDRLDMTNDFKTIDNSATILNKNYPDNVFVKQFYSRVEIERKTAIGSLAPEISLPNPEGQLIKLSELKGKIVLLDFWAAWCMPCRRENPHVVEIYNKYKDMGFDVFSVSLDRDKTSWTNAIVKDQLTWKNHVSDLKYWKSEAALEYGVHSIPKTFLLDREGRIVAKNLRGEDLEKAIIKLFNENK